MTISNFQHERVQIRQGRPECCLVMPRNFTFKHLAELTDSITTDQTNETSLYSLKCNQYWDRPLTFI